MDDFRAVCGQSKWKRRRTEDLQKVCADALADARLNRFADTIRFLQCRDRPLGAPSAFTRCRTQMVLTLSEAITIGQEPKRPTKKIRLATLPSLTDSITFSKDQFLSYVERSLPQWRQCWEYDNSRKDLYSICAKAMTGQRRLAPDTLHVYCPHAGERDHLPFCVQRFWSNFEDMCFDIIVPDILLSDRLHQWSCTPLKKVRAADASDVKRTRPPSSAHACTRIWTVSTFAALTNPKLKLYSVVVADDLEWWPPYAKLNLGRVHARAIVVGCSLQIWKHQRGFKGITPYIAANSSNYSYICYLPSRARREAVMQNTGAHSFKSVSTTPLVITLQLAHAYIMWLAILSEHLMENVLFGYLSDMHTAWRSFAIACNATTHALAGYNLPAELLDRFVEVRRWTIRAFLTELSATQKRATLRQARQNILTVTESVEMNLGHVCYVCLAPLGQDELSQKAHACDWNGLNHVHLPEVEEAGAVTVAGFFREYDSHTSQIHCIRRFIRERRCIDSQGSGDVHYQNVRVGEELLRSWYRALASENLNHLFDSTRCDSTRCDSSTTLSKRGAILTILGTQHFRDCCPYTHTCNGYRQFWEEAKTPEISVLSKVPTGICQDNKIVRMLTAQIAASMRSMPNISHSTPQLTLAALSCVSPQLPALLGTDWRLVGSSTAMFHRWNFYADVQVVNLLPSFFLARDSCSRLRQLMNRGVLPNTRWCAPEGSPAHLALELILPS